MEPEYFVGFLSDWAAGFVLEEHSEQVDVQGKVAEVSPPDTRKEEACSRAPRIRFK